MKLEITGHRRWGDSPQRIGEPDLVIHHAGVLRLIDTRRSSLNTVYVESLMARSLQQIEGRTR